MASKKRLFLLMVIFLLFVGIGVYAYIQQLPNPGHGADKVLISVNGFSMTLQEAIDYGFLVDGGSKPTESYSTSGDHTASEIYVSVDGDGKTLQDAILTTLCGSMSSSYLPEIGLGHNADEILVSIDSEEMTFQEAISEGKFCEICVSHSYVACYGHPSDYTGGDLYWHDSCGNVEELKSECKECRPGGFCVIASGIGCESCPDGLVQSASGGYQSESNLLGCKLIGTQGRYLYYVTTPDEIIPTWTPWSTQTFAARCYFYSKQNNIVVTDEDYSWQIGVPVA